MASSQFRDICYTATWNLYGWLNLIPFGSRPIRHLPLGTSVAHWVEEAKSWWFFLFPFCCFVLYFSKCPYLWHFVFFQMFSNERNLCLKASFKMGLFYKFILFSFLVMGFFNLIFFISKCFSQESSQTPIYYSIHLLFSVLDCFPPLSVFFSLSLELFLILSALGWSIRIYLSKTSYYFHISIFFFFSFSGWKYIFFYYSHCSESLCMTSFYFSFSKKEGINSTLRDRPDDYF